MTIIVIPCYNEASRFDSSAVSAFLETSTGIELLFVDDGSTDTTASLLAECTARCGGKAALLQLDSNCGKAEAVRQGILAGLQQPAERLGFWDADLATPLETIPDFIRLMAENPARQLICGARVQRLGATITRHWYRHYPGRMIATCISIILGLPMYDSQCGAKLMSRSLARQLFSTPFLSPWLFDVEIVARIIAAEGRKRAAHIIYEHPLQEWRDVGHSKIGLDYLPRIPLELVRIYRSYHKQLKD